MKIFGIGTDIVNIKRIENSIKKNGNSFTKRVFTKNEIFYCEKKKYSASFFAKRYAAKEAFSKALGVGISKGIKFKNIEVFNNKDGKPSIKLSGKALSYIKKKMNNKKYQIYLSLSDDKPWAQATAIISYLK